VLSNVYAQVRLAIARTQAEALARELGYTPDDLLLSRTDINNVNIITGSAYCDAELYFVTSLGFDEFEARLMQTRPGTWRVNPSPGKVRYWWYLPIDTYAANGNKVEDEELLPPVLKLSWDLPSENDPLAAVGYRTLSIGAADLYETEEITLTLKYGDRPIEDNIAVIKWYAGRYPIWVVCL
jgi:hypothetical protein